MAERVTQGIVSALLVFGYTAVVLAGGPPAAEGEIARGHALLEAARLEAAGEAREALLSEAVEAFKSGYRWFGRGTQVRSLLGAAQGYLMMQTPRRVFPFLWQATPLQRAERSTQQALVMQPDNPAAAFLLALVYGRYAQDSEEPSEAAAMSRRFALQAAELGLPVVLPGAVGDAPQLFHLQDKLLALMYFDGRGTGEPDHLLFIFAKPDDRFFGVVVADGTKYPLTTDAATGALWSHGAYEGVVVKAQPPDAARIIILVRQKGVRGEVSFVWKGGGFGVLR